ncbi:MAG: DUF1579 domain-containing protein [Phycisphaerae bacterium]|nr:DUF1579 domain-containing protein [Phycisphaerae bacterium]MDW8262108.1 DUF1579 domain-containing protein [Phycisphaerales bacterium]
MKLSCFLTTLTGSLAVVALTGVLCTADPVGAAEPADSQRMQLPAGWTIADIQTCIEAGTPGKMHEFLAKSVGRWTGTQTRWMYPAAEPVSSRCDRIVTSIYDGRYLKVEMHSEIPGIGPLHGFGLYGYDNVTKEFVSTWIDSWGTGIMNGTGKLDPDGKILHWSYKYNCPLTKRPATIREVQTVTGPNTRIMEWFTTDPKSGQEYQMLRVEFERD